MGVIPAAGTIPWRRRRGELQVALVHRPKYDDWSWPKGKLDPGEDWPVAAVRETLEETSLPVSLGQPLPPAAYTVLDREGQPVTKEVRYWSAESVGRGGPLRNEIDEVCWLGVADADLRLDYARDRDQLRALVRADQLGRLTTWPLAIIRHAHARPRSSWSGADSLRPLDGRGHGRAAAVGPILAAYGITRLVSSPSTRCADTLRPYARAAGLALRLKPGLSEEGYATDAARAPHHLCRLLVHGEAAALCSHGPVLPDLLNTLVGQLPDADPDGTASRLLKEAARDGMAKGEVLVVHVLDRGENARLVAIERHLP